MLPPNVEHLSVYRHVRKVLTPLTMGVEHVLSVAPSRFRRLQTISLEARYSSMERDRKHIQSRAGLGPYESPEAIMEFEVRGQKEGITVKWDDDWSRQNLVVR